MNTHHILHALPALEGDVQIRNIGSIGLKGYNAGPRMINRNEAQTGFLVRPKPTIAYSQGTECDSPAEAQHKFDQLTPRLFVHTCYLTSGPVLHSINKTAFSTALFSETLFCLLGRVAFGVKVSALVHAIHLEWKVHPLPNLPLDYRTARQ